ncbi:Xaa-Pro peptidase family protein [Ruminococcaceae bacterium OttesenSCG-928-L11]|nr:Xaa-Pro peptidase family protein [Ruminococcaceae bacterium OttesenSCG-928-L11]
MNQIERFRPRIPDHVDAVLIRSNANRAYFTGFRTTAGTLLFTREKAFYIVDSRYIEITTQSVKHCTVLLEEKLEDQLRQLVSENGIRTVGTETTSLSFADMRRFAAMVAPAQLLEDNDTTDAISRQRCIKTAEEIEFLTRAQDITDRAFLDGMEAIRPGVCELDAINRMGMYMAKNGSDSRTFDFIFTSGARTSLPHGSKAYKDIEAGDFVMMDMGCQVGGYGSDMTRTVAVSHVTPEQRSVYEIVLEAQQRALALIRPGVRCRDVDAAARDYIAAKGYGDNFGHGLGHSLGIEIHENPRFNQVTEDVLEEGMVMTVEPGIYLPGRFGVRIEDMVVVTASGYHNMTKSPKELVVL